MTTNTILLFMLGTSLIGFGIFVFFYNRTNKRIETLQNLHEQLTIAGIKKDWNEVDRIRQEIMRRCK